ncbi:unnamed protein product, partial [Mesorhabditis belari]|uniref:Small acidic protein-like domain-containing protein n=1 Tax=Mesorhabditis belari TaxID=2138241 RepID=A0AAF3J1D9_9BILA
MPTHKKFSDSSDEDNTLKKHDEKEKHRSKDIGKEEKTHSSSASRDREREKRKEHESRKNRDESHRHEEKKRDRSRERHDESRKNRDRDDDRREHRNRDANREDRNRRDDRRDNTRKHRDRPRRQRDEEEESTDGPAWATSRVKEHAEKLKERKLIWHGKKDGEAEQAEEGESSSMDQQAAKNMGMWSSAIAATGVDNKQAEKFKRLLGFKGAASQQAPQTSSADVSAEREKQKNMLKSLDRQFAIARETTHTGRGLGLGFH